MQKKWVIQSAEIPEDVNFRLGTYPSIARMLLHQRGLSDELEAEVYMNPASAPLPAPASVYGLVEAVDRITAAVDQSQMICVYGDYDTDGITSVSILVRVLKKITNRVCYYLPERGEGYGLNVRALQSLQEKWGVELVIAVDCGIRAVEEAAEARRMGMDLIIIDHHLPAEVLPQGVLIVDPKVCNNDGAFSEYCGAGLSYLLASELLHRKNLSLDEDLLALAAVGTIADMVPLVGENRILAAHGLRALKNTSLAGLKALFKEAGISSGSIQSTTVGFVIAPRLNAAGRIDSATTAVELLLETDVTKAGELAARLEGINSSRRKSMAETIEAAGVKIGAMDQIPPIIFLADPEFSEGVVGLAAARINEQYYRPVIIGAVGDKVTRASARSIKEVNIVEVLGEVGSLLLRHGGHSAAAGFTVANENLGLLERSLQEIGEKRLAGVNLEPSLSISKEVDLSLLNEDLLKFIERLEPFGMANPYPVFAARGVKVLSSRAVGSGKEHLKLTLQQKGKFFDAIAFKQAHHLGKMDSLIDIAYRFDWNEYMGVRTPQLVIEDIQY